MHSSSAPCPIEAAGPGNWIPHPQKCPVGRRIEVKAAETEAEEEVEGVAAAVEAVVVEVGVEVMVEEEADAEGVEVAEVVRTIIKTTIRLPVVAEEDGIKGPRCKCSTKGKGVVATSSSSNFSPVETFNSSVPMLALVVAMIRIGAKVVAEVGVMGVAVVVDEVGVDEVAEEEGVVTESEELLIGSNILVVVSGLARVKSPAQ